MNREQIMDQLAIEYIKTLKDARYCRLNGHEETANQARHQALGIEQAAEALGIEHRDFIEYARAKRAEMKERGRKARKMVENG